MVVGRARARWSTSREEVGWDDVEHGQALTACGWSSARRCDTRAPRSWPTTANRSKPNVAHDFDLVARHRPLGVVAVVGPTGGLGRSRRSRAGRRRRRCSLGQLRGDPVPHRVRSAGSRAAAGPGRRRPRPARGCGRRPRRRRRSRKPRTRSLLPHLDRVPALATPRSPTASRRDSLAAARSRAARTTHPARPPTVRSSTTRSGPSACWTDIAVLSRPSTAPLARPSAEGGSPPGLAAVYPVSPSVRSTTAPTSTPAAAPAGRSRSGRTPGRRRRAAAGVGVPGRTAGPCEPARDPHLRTDHHHGVEREQGRAEAGVTSSRAPTPAAPPGARCRGGPGRCAGRAAPRDEAGRAARDRWCAASAPGDGGPREAHHEGGAHDVRRGVHEERRDDGRSLSARRTPCRASAPRP